MNMRCLFIFSGVLLGACSNIHLVQPSAEAVGNVMVDTMYRQQSQQQCANGADPYAKLLCQKQAQQQMQQYRKEQQKTVGE